MSRAIGGVRLAAAQDGSAPVEFALVSALLVLLLMAVVQVAIYVHVRNVVTASAAEGARFAANANVPTEVGAARATELVRSAVGTTTADALACTAGAESGAGGAVLVAVRCEGQLPAFFLPWGGILPVDVTGRALKEGT